MISIFLLNTFQFKFDFDEKYSYNCDSNEKTHPLFILI